MYNSGMGNGIGFLLVMGLVGTAVGIISIAYGIYYLLAHLTFVWN